MNVNVPTKVHLACARMLARSYTAKQHIAISTIEIRFGEIDGKRVAAIRGSESMGDWARNLRVAPTRSRILKAWVHNGFLTSALAVKDAMLKEIKKNGPFHIITGHSKGAAEAVLLSALLKKWGYAPIEMIAFAEPRTFCRWSSSTECLTEISTSKYVIDGDWVPEIPKIFYQNRQPEWKWLEADDPHNIDTHIAKLEKFLG